MPQQSNQTTLEPTSETVEPNIRIEGPDQPEDYSDLGAVEINEEDYSDLGAVELPEQRNLEISEFHPLNTLSANIKRFFTSQDEITNVATAQNIYALSKITGLSMPEVSKNYDTLRVASNITGMDVLDTKRMVNTAIAIGIAAPVIAAAPATLPILGIEVAKTGAGLATFMLLDQIIPVRKWMEEFEQREGATINPNLKKVIIGLDFISKGLATHGIMKAAPKVAEGFMHNSITEYNLPKEISLTSEQVADIWQTSTKLTEAEKGLFLDLGLEGKELIAAIKGGVKIKVPTEKLIKLVDTPIWAKIKATINKPPTNKVTSQFAGKGTEAPAGLIEAPKSEVVTPGVRIEGPKEEFVKGGLPELPKPSTPTGGGKVDSLTRQNIESWKKQGGEARGNVEFVSVEELEKYREHDREITPKTSDDKTLDTLTEDIRKNGMKEPISVRYYKANRTAYIEEGNTRLAAAKRLGLKEVPVWVRRSEGTPVSYAKPIRGIEPNQHGYVPGDLKPSEIGFASKPPTPTGEGKVESIPPPSQPPPPIGPSGTPEVPGTGGKRVLGMPRSLAEEALLKGITDDLGTLPTYDTMNKREQAERALDLFKTDPARTKRIAMGQEYPKPEDALLPEAAYLFIKNKAIVEGDVSTMRELASSKNKLAVEEKVMGQRISLLRGEKGELDPVERIKEVNKALGEKAQKKYGTKDTTKLKEETVKEIKNEVKKVKATSQDWEAFIRSIQC